MRNNILSSGSGLLHDLESRFSQLADEQPQQGKPAQQQPEAGQQKQASADVEVVPAQVEPASPAQPSDGNVEDAPQGKDGSDAR